MYKYLKIILIVTIFVVVASTTTNVSANSGPPIRGIMIEPDVCEIIYSEEYEGKVTVFPNNFDILVQIDNFDNTRFGEMTDQYKKAYPFYEDIDYLKDMETGWTSFSAYYTNDEYFIEEEPWGDGPYCGIHFGDYREVKIIESIKLVYFDDNGDTLYLSDELAVPDVLFYQDRNTIIYFNTTTLTIDSRLKPTIDILFMISVFFLILYSVVIEIIVAVIFKFRTKKILLNIILINVVTQITMYVYFYWLYNPHGHSYSEHLMFYEIFVLIVEFLYLNWRFKKTITWKRLMFYVLVSNIVSYFLGVFRYL